MSNQPRVVKVLAALLASMTAGAVILMALGHHPPAAGPWSLWNSLRLDAVSEAIGRDIPQAFDRWNRIEVCYSDTSAGNVESLATVAGFASPKEINCHFVLCNGRGGGDGEILPTESWLRQWSIVPGRGWFGNGKTIRICVVADGKTTQPTNFQMRKIEALVKELSERFSIDEPVLYPRNWHQ